MKWDIRWHKWFVYKSVWYIWHVTCVWKCVFILHCKSLYHTARYDMWRSSIGTRYMPVFIISHRVSLCVRLLLHATVLRAKMHINIALCVEKSIMLPPPLQCIRFSGLSSEFIKTQPLTLYVFFHPKFFCLYIFLILFSFYFTHFYEITFHFR